MKQYMHKPASQKKDAQPIEIDQNSVHSIIVFKLPSYSIVCFATKRGSLRKHTAALL